MSQEDRIFFDLPPLPKGMSYDDAHIGLHQNGLPAAE